MSKVEDIIAASKLNELIRKKDEDDKTCRTVLWVLAIVGAIAAVAAIAYAVYCFFTPDYLEDFGFGLQKKMIRQQPRICSPFTIFPFARIPK